MDLIVLLLVVVLIGFIVWVVTSHVPMPPGWARAIQVICLILVVIWLLTKLFKLPNVLS